MLVELHVTQISSIIKYIYFLIILKLMNRKFCEYINSNMTGQSKQRYFVIFKANS